MIFYKPLLGVVAWPLSFYINEKLVEIGIAAFAQKLHLTN
jgi:hypothetical protein